MFFRKRTENSQLGLTIPQLRGPNFFPPQSINRLIIIIALRFLLFVFGFYFFRCVIRAIDNPLVVESHVFSCPRREFRGVLTQRGTVRRPTELQWTREFDRLIRDGRPASMRPPRRAARCSWPRANTYAGFQHTFAVTIFS